MMLLFACQQNKYIRECQNRVKTFRHDVNRKNSTKLQKNQLYYYEAGRKLNRVKLPIRLVFLRNDSENSRKRKRIWNVWDNNEYREYY